jgi:peptidoglycan/LPS O-acetylase OafA/YrhL
MRWVAALLVFAYHVHVIQYFEAGWARRIVDWAFGAGVTGVSFFFILSGFVLAWSARDGGRPQKFWLRRIARIYPVHFVTALAALALIWLQSPDLLPAGDALVANLLLVHSWRLDSRFNQSLDPVSWSLACEAFFYAVFPLIFVWLRRLGHRAIWGVAAFSVLAVLTIPFVVERQTMQFFPLARLSEFVLGMALACLVSAGRLRVYGFAAAIAVTVAGYALASSVGTPHRYAACTVFGFALLITAAATADLEARPFILRHRLLIRLGELSFAFYMVHILVTRMAEFVLPHRPELPPLTALFTALALFAASLGLAWVLYEWVERPGRDLVMAGPKVNDRVTAVHLDTACAYHYAAVRPGVTIGDVRVPDASGYVFPHLIR